MKILIPSPVVGLQTKKEDKAYRLMHYVVQQEVEEGVLLYNTLTCAMALVTHEEAKNLTAVEGLIEHRFLVPVDHDDKKFCKILRIGAKLMQKRPKGIRQYTIVTTTGCNARCAYCFEKGIKPVHMTMETAEKVAQYIISHRGEHEEVKIRWYGGEPLYNFKVMDRICTHLKEHNIKYYSYIITNGYLFSDKMVEKACLLWNVKEVQVTLDGTEENYNRIKAYVHTNGVSPYQRVMENIKRLLEAKIPTIKIRIHLQHNNFADMWALTKECGERFHTYDNFHIYFMPLFEYFDTEEQISIQRKSIFDEKTKLEKYVQSLGVKGHPRQNMKEGLVINQCMVDSEEAILIVPDGHIGLCDTCLDSRFIGHIDSNEWNLEVVKQLREYWDEIPECDTCAYYPKCYRLKICVTRKECFKELREDMIASIKNKMLRDYHELKRTT
jgi:radical SAM protein with 4Fe4S-binding SPASM domain